MHNTGCLQLNDAASACAGRCLQELLSAGKGRLRRATESGQLLLDLMRHADVAEWALWINSFGDSIYKAVWGDKDTFQLAFAVAGKAHEFNQLQVTVVGGNLHACREVVSAASVISLPTAAMCERPACSVLEVGWVAVVAPPLHERIKLLLCIPYDTHGQVGASSAELALCLCLCVCYGMRSSRYIR